ncbi:rhodanese-related sulfurtransferase [Thermonema lapsum]|uniref:Rhodanese-related sulfurtransferase n=1 Tax=Thermonema lapsum TaxID=28195 RepID=A0A846MQX1_9BACT|nr:rhodanese-like domain-containing protein [Thermonema lapsum]NIK73963.1 rhodanese-related sulfurtransferase [Thermonema lapsum]
MKLWSIKWITLVALLLTACSGASQSKEGQDLPPTTFAQKLKEQPGVVLDVRTPEEYTEGHLPNAQLLNFYDERFRQKLEQLDKNQTYYVYCRSGGRSSRAVALMRELGFKKVYNLKGGIMDWQASQLPIER